MSWNSETSDCETCKIHYNTTLGQVKVEDLDNEETWLTPIDATGTEYVSSNLVPGFKCGKWMILIGKKIKEALT